MNAARLARLRALAASPGLGGLLAELSWDAISADMARSRHPSTAGFPFLDSGHCKQCEAAAAGLAAEGRMR